jgi:hypothetical protein
MNRSGKILFSLVCAMAFSGIAQADGQVKPPKPFVPKFHPVAPPGMPGMPQPNGATATSAQPSSPASNFTANTPYNSIAARNVFGLNPMPAIIKPDPDAGNPPPKITLTGITTIFGPSEALYKVAGYSRPGQAAVPDQSYILREGESQDDVTVKSINVKDGIVTFINRGETQDIPLSAGVASGGASGSGGPPPNYAGFAGRGGVNNNMSDNLRQRLQQRFGNNNPGNAYNNNNNSDNFGSGGSSTASPQSVSSVNGGYVNGIYTFGNQSGQSGQSTTPQLSADDTAALIAAQHAQAQQNGDPSAALYPPTSYDGQANQEIGGGSSDSGSGGGGPGMPTLIPTKFPHH